MNVENKTLSTEKNVPKLRFREFDSSWIFEPLSSCLVEHKEKAPANTEMPVYTSSRTGLYPQNSYFDNRELQNYGEYGVVPVGFFVYRHMSDDSIFKFNVNNVGSKIAVSKEYPVFTAKQMDSLFLLEYLNHGKQFKQFASMQKQGGTRTRLYFKKLVTLKLPTPTLPEQQKIASFLSKVDEKIALLSEKKDKLTEYKRGVMQQLFSGKWIEDNGELTFIPPTLRFKADDGTEFPDWEEKTLGELSEAPSYGLNSAAKKYDGLNKYIRITDIDEMNRTFTPNPLTSPEDFDESYVLKEGDLVFARTGASVGKSYLYNHQDGRLLFAGFLIKFTISKAIPKFVSYQVTTSQYESWIKVMSVRSGQPGINAQEYATYPLFVAHVDEQAKIINFLSAIDQKIDLTNSELNKAKEWKKGLLQQMFV